MLSSRSDHALSSRSGLSAHTATKHKRQIRRSCFVELSSVRASNAQHGAAPGATYTPVGVAGPVHFQLSPRWRSQTCRGARRRKPWHSLGSCRQPPGGWRTQCRCTAMQASSSRHRSATARAEPSPRSARARNRRTPLARKCATGRCGLQACSAPRARGPACTARRQ